MSLTASRERGLVLPIDRVLLVVGVLLLALVLVLTQRLAADVGDALTRNTVRLSLAWYTVALCLMMGLAADDWTARSTRGRLARGCWTWAFVCFLVHLGMAFHYYHHWSHAHAFERTRQVSGVGQGVYVSYFFTALWGADVAWWWLRPVRYAARSVGLDRALHGFMLFIVFNSMVVYETGPIRWAGVLMFGLLAAAWFTARRRPRDAGRV